MNSALQSLPHSQVYDELSDQGYTSLPKSGQIEIGQMVSEKVKLTLFLCISITNNVKSYKKINERAQTTSFSVFTMGGR